jgi:quinol monooxygenase YgiN
MSGPDAVVVIARWQTTEAALDEVLTHVAGLRAQSLAEPGCVGYEVFQSRTEPTTLMLVERYRDGAAAEAHRATPHFQDLVLERIVPLLTDRQVEILEDANV